MEVATVVATEEEEEEEEVVMEEEEVVMEEEEEEDLKEVEGSCPALKDSLLQELGSLPPLIEE